MLKVQYDDLWEKDKPDIEQDFSCDADFADAMRTIIDRILIDELIRITPSERGKSPTEQKSMISNKRKELLKLIDSQEPDMTYVNAESKVNTYDKEMAKLVFN